MSIAGVVGSIGAFIGSGFGIKWILKAKNILGAVKGVIRETRDLIDEGADVSIPCKEFLDKCKVVKLGDTSPENVAKMDTAMKSGMVFAIESQQALKELDELKGAIIKLRDAIK